ncbi:hypothetical protein [Nocardiopsis sp. YSL2]|uniref:hypothetical protein n=1 Tax=Nocardiopsis sp. YSL2 TaxID=2939492 RepID=UPI0026F47979|nr:hypothetical protein [Nocardiopsis sp. YSL2]
MSNSDWMNASDDEFEAMLAEWKRAAAERAARDRIRHRMASTVYRHRLRSGRWPR